MAKEYWEAKDVEMLAEENVIKEWHPDLREFKIAYVFTDDIKIKGRAIAAKIKKASPLEQFISGQQILLIVNYDVWQRVDIPYKLALLDHEFHHVKVFVDKVGRPELVMLDHDIEEFNDVLRRHGAWRNEVKDFLEIAEQLSLPLGNASNAVHKAAQELKDSIPAGGSMTLTAQPGTPEAESYTLKGPKTVQ